MFLTLFQLLFPPPVVDAWGSTLSPHPDSIMSLGCVYTPRWSWLSRIVISLGLAKSGGLGVRQKVGTVPYHTRKIMQECPVMRKTKVLWIGMWGWLQVISGSSRALAAWTSPGFQCQMKWGNLSKPNDQFSFFHKKKKHHKIWGQYQRRNYHQDLKLKMFICYCYFILLSDC